jgi:hypothetical protein
MKYIFNSLIVLLFMGWCLTTLAQPVSNNAFDLAPTLQKHATDPNQEAIWDLLMSFDVTTLSGAAGNAGAEWDGTYFYSTRWASNLIHKYNSTGTALIEQFSIPGVTGLRDLAFDGQYMYGGAAANTIYMMDFTSKTLIGTIPSPVAVRFIAYDVAADAFWCGTWADNLTLVSRSGATLATIPATALAGKYGCAYDNVSAGGPYLYVFDQGAGAGTPQIIYQYNIATGTQTGVTHDVTLQFPGTSGIAGGLFSMSDWQAGMFTLGGLLQGTPDMYFVYEITPAGPPCTQIPDNPNPANNATNVPVTGVTLSWSNTGAYPPPTEVELQFGPSGSMTTVYSGSVITSWAVPSTLLYFTNYQWKVINKIGGSCSYSGPTWGFKTMQNPNIANDTKTVYPQNVNMWTGTTEGSTKTDGDINTVFPNVGWAVFDVSSLLQPVAAVNSVHFYGYVNATNWPYWSATPMGSVNPITDPAANIYSQVNAGSAQGTAYIFSNEASSFAPGWHDYECEATVKTDVLNAVPSGRFAMGFVDRDGLATYYINFDGHASTNRPYLVINYDYIVPVELTSFTAKADENQVELSWITATETNNQGFEVQRSNGGEFEAIAFVQGHGTTTEVHAYSFIDNNVNAGIYTYRLKQVDFDGRIEYSNVIEANVPVPAVFGLEQNYPNPFNPSTSINFKLAVDSKVSLKVFDILGQEIATLVNGNFVAGSHTATFNASQLNSGVYMYRLEATGVDGRNFVDIKKMILTK